MQPEPLEVLPYDGVFRCLVRSASNPKRVYLVDLEANHGAGFCGCYEWEFRLHPKIRRLTPKERRESEGKYFCKHQRAAFALRAKELFFDIVNKRAEQARKK